ncbi:MAG TPA: metal ABC transporter substrate-binding protein, partial [Clostridia bacterium]|nr:metal ABC transporter substrate-binding protein [Clostridia bacterium]
MQRWVALLLALLCICGLSAASAEPNRLKVIATMFPVYDIARAIGGERADVTMLMPIGMECHNFEPTPSDILEINKADLFAYTGPAMEPWAQRILDGQIDPKFEVLDVSAGVPVNVAGEDGGGPAQIWTDPQRMKIMAQTFCEAL